MPIYSFKCSDCGVEDRVLLMKERNYPQNCKCGKAMTRLFTFPSRITMKKTGRDKVLDTLNYEEGKGLRSPRSKAALTKGLDYEKPVIGRGFTAVSEG